MKIRPINKDILLCYGIGATAIALGAGIFAATYKGVSKDAEYLKQNAPEKYEYLKNKYGIEPFRGSAEAWSTVAQMHRDSVENSQKVQYDEELKLDSIAKTNYAKGMQIIKDSLANTNN